MGLPITYNENLSLKNFAKKRDKFQVKKKLSDEQYLLKFLFSKKAAAKIDEIFTDNLTLYSKCQIGGKDFVNFCCLLRKHEL